MRDALIIARLRERARNCRRTAFAMEPSFARAAVERLAARWEAMARAHVRQAELASCANDP